MKRLKENLVLIFISLILGFSFVFVFFRDEMDFITDPIYELFLPNQVRDTWIEVNQKSIDNQQFAVLNSDVDAKYITIAVEFYNDKNQVVDRILITQFNVEANKEYYLELDFSELEIDSFSYYNFKLYSSKR